MILTNIVWSIKDERHLTHFVFYPFSKNISKYGYISATNSWKLYKIIYFSIYSTEIYISCNVWQHTNKYFSNHFAIGESLDTF